MKYKTNHNKLNVDCKVENFVISQLDNSKNLKLMLIKIDKNVYVFYGKYVIVEEPNYCTVDTGTKKYRFGTLKTATTWCVFKERRMITQSKEIEFIDSKLSSLQLELMQHSALLRNTKDKEMIHIYDNKVNQDEYLKEVLLKKLNKYINMAKRWQIVQFEDAKTNNKR